MRYEKIKIWPEVSGFYPALISFRNISAKKKNPILVQFTSVQEIDSSGLAILTCRLIQLYQKAPSRLWNFYNFYDLPEELENKLIQLNFINIVNQYQQPNDLFSCINSEKNVVVQTYNGIKKYSFPVYYLNYKQQIKPREVVEEFIDWIVNVLNFTKNKGYKFKLNAFIQILKEIAKNSEDHTSNNAFFGIDIIEYTENNIDITFTFCDLGSGIYKNILEVLTLNPNLFKDKNKHLGLTDVYHFAMTINNSCSRNNNGRNRGLGMSIIHDGAQEINLELSVFDAESRGIISSLSTISHEELRKYFINIGNTTGFFYYGKLSLNK